MTVEFDFDKTLKTKSANEFLNFQHFLFPSARLITRLLYKTSVTPHQVILVSLLIGLASSLLIIQGNMGLVIIGAFLLFYKNVLDKVDGSLARIKNLVSRRGRFYDSLTDFIVGLAVFSAIGYKLSQLNSDLIWYVISYLALICSMLQCSFFIYYEVAYIHFSGKGSINRLSEAITDEDKRTQDKFTLLLQRIYLLIYGWQDWLILKLDEFLFKKLNYQSQTTNLKSNWYYHKTFLSLASLLPIGSHIVLISLFALIGNFEIYLWINLVVMNSLMLFLIPFHYFSVKSKLQK